MYSMQDRRWVRTVVATLCAVVALAPASFSVQQASAQYERGEARAPVAFTQQQLDQMLAPIALYPDSLLSQILIAATYPLEVVEATRWSRAHPNLEGQQAVNAVDEKRWDPSVKSLVAFPRVLAMMNERLQWTRDLGDAFLEQEPHVMDTVQNLRRRAMAAGTLRSGGEILVERHDRYILIEPADPAVVYVPYYDPLLVYGTWWWPAYPPVRWAPWPRYYAYQGYGGPFVWGPAITVGTVFFFGAFDWRRRHTTVVYVNEQRRTIVNSTTIVRHVNHRQAAQFPRWRHDPMHRRGVTYRTETLRHRIRQEQASIGTEARERERRMARGTFVTPNTATAPIRQERQTRNVAPNTNPHPQNDRAPAIGNESASTGASARSQRPSPPASDRASRPPPTPQKSASQTVRQQQLPPEARDAGRERGRDMHSKEHRRSFETPIANSDSAPRQTRPRSARESGNPPNVRAGDNQPAVVTPRAHPWAPTLRAQRNPPSPNREAYRVRPSHNQPETTLLPRADGPVQRQATPSPPAPRERNNQHGRSRGKGERDGA